MVQELIVIDEVVLTNATVRLLSDDIFHIKWKDAIDIEISDIDELEVVYERFSCGKKLKVIQDLEHFTSISNEARTYGAEKSPEVEALAYIIKGLGQRLLIKFYLNIRRAKNPTKVFTRYEDALEWFEKLD